MVKVAVDAGHGVNTPGKRSPVGEREWHFNNHVVKALIGELDKYADVQILRLDDPTGERDVPLQERTNKANDWGADFLVSVHHNALGGAWKSHGGVETFVMEPMNNNPKSKALAEKIHPRIVRVMGLKDRGIKAGNLHMLRESNMPAILTEGGFMDSTIDIQKLRKPTILAAQGVTIATGIAEYFSLKKKSAEVSNLSEEQVLNEAQEEVRKKAMELGITDGKNPFRQVNQHYVWSALIPIVERLKALEESK